MHIERLFPEIKDITDEYKSFRSKGESRDQAYLHVIQEHEKELSDKDDSAKIWIGLAKATGDKNELTEELLSKAEIGFDELAMSFPEVQSIIFENKQLICSPERIGSEVESRIKKVFKPDWQTGDTFIYQLPDIQEKLESLDPSLKGSVWSLKNKVVLVRKVQERLSENGVWKQIVYLSICEQNKLPRNDDEINMLGYLPSLLVDQNKYEFKFSIEVKTKRALEAYHLTKIGCFPNIISPKCEVEPPPLRGAIPLFSKLNSRSLSPIEVYTCFYLKYGLLH